jgi:hypothetical protein
MNVEEEFIRNLFVRGETHLGRVFVHYNQTKLFLGLADMSINVVTALTKGL